MRASGLSDGGSSSKRSSVSGVLGIDSPARGGSQADVGQVRTRHARGAGNAGQRVAAAAPGLDEQQLGRCRWRWRCRRRRRAAREDARGGAGRRVRVRSPCRQDSAVPKTKAHLRGHRLPSGAWRRHARASSSSPIAARTTSSGKAAAGSPARRPAGWSACSRRWRGDRAWRGSAACPSRPTRSKRAKGLFTTAADQTDPRLHVVPVPLPAPTFHAYYGQISNEVLWMLQHHVIGSGGFESLDYARHQAWGRYLEANARLATAVARSGRQPRAFLVQDYHLYPLPGLLRSSYPDTPILHFTHIPFPDPPILRLIPQTWRETILRGMLGADVVGLQTPMDVRSFLACCAEFLDVTVDAARSAVRLQDGREVCVRAYPASVDAARAAAEHALTRGRRRARTPDCRQRRVQHHPCRSTRSQQEPAGRLSRVRATAGDAARPVRSGAIPGADDPVAHRPGHLSRLSRRGVQRPSTR